MKFLTLLFILILTFSASAQICWEIELSNKITDKRMGIWTTGDYSIFVELDSINNALIRNKEGHARSFYFYCDKDSNLSDYFEASLNRYERAVKQLYTASKGFDLQNLIINDGLENKGQNTSKSRIIERLIKQFVEKDNAIVYYKGQRIFKLTYLSEALNSGNANDSITDILNRGYEIKTYFDNPGNCIFSESYIYGW
jgi:hypothetical protein